MSKLQALYIKKSHHFYYLSKKYEESLNYEDGVYSYDYIHDFEKMLTETNNILEMINSMWQVDMISTDEYLTYTDKFNALRNKIQCILQ